MQSNPGFWSPWLYKLWRLARIAAANAVPLWGVFREDWSNGTALALFWCENVISIFLVGALIIAHRCVTRRQGHDFPQYDPKIQEGEPVPVRERRPWQFLKQFLGTTIAFTFVHGIFLAALFFLLLPSLGQIEMIEKDELREGVRYLALALVGGFAFDLVNLQKRSFAWVHEQEQFLTGRMGTVHFSILIGMFALAFTNRPGTFFSVFAGLKILSDLSGILPVYKPKEAPSVFVKLIALFKGDTEDFIRYWRETDATEAAWRAEDELPIPERKVSAKAPGSGTQSSSQSARRSARSHPPNRRRPHSALP